MKKIKFYTALGITGVVALSILFSFVTPSPQASAAPQPVADTYKWVDMHTITDTYVDQTQKTVTETFSGPQLFGGKIRYVSNAGDYIQFDKNPTAQGATPGKGSLTTAGCVNGVDPTGQPCSLVKNKAITILDTQKATTSAAYVACVSHTAGNSYQTCLQQTAQNICTNQISKPGVGGVNLDLNACIQQQLATAVGAPPGGVDPGTDKTPTNSASSSTDSNTNPELDCGTTKSELDWIICPVVKLVNTGLNALDAAISALLHVDPNTLNENDPNSGALYYKAWQSFRGIALGVLVIAALVMVGSQALGFELLDAYTLKKVLPRLIVAMIGISLSWELMKWFVQVTNDLGYGIQQVIYYPFRSLNGDGGIIGGGSGILITLLTGGAMLAMGIAIMFSFVVTALLGLLTAFLILILRQLVIVVLIMMAPIAIACYVLPNTQNVWKLWHESFSKALLMFPIIMAFLATGRVFAEVSAKNGNPVNQIVAFVAYIIPYFLIPVAFRFAGGALRTIGGFVNDRNKGMFDRLKKGRAARGKDRLTRARNNQLWDPNSKLGKLNSAASMVTDPGSNLAYYGRRVPGLRKAGARVASQLEHARVAQSTKLFEELNKAGYNDKAYRVLSGAHDDLSEETRNKLSKKNLLNRAPKSLSELHDIQHILGESDSASERIASNAIEGSMGRLATLYKDPEMGKASLQAAGIMGLAAHGFAAPSDLAQVGNMLKADGGRGYAQSVISTAQVMGSRGRPDVKAGYGVAIDSNGNFVDGINEGGRALSLINSLQSQDLASAKAGAIKNLSPHIRKIIDAGKSPGASMDQVNTAQAVKDQMFQWAGQYSSASVDVKAETLKLIDFYGLRGEFNERNRTLSPEEIAAMKARGEVPPDASAGGEKQ